MQYMAMYQAFQIDCLGGRKYVGFGGRGFTSAALSTAWCSPALAVAEAEVGVAAVTARLGEAAARRADAAAAAVIGLPAMNARGKM